LGCGKTYESAEDAKDHILSTHPEVSDPVILVNMGESPKPTNVVSFCPLCNEQVSSLREYARHVGRHQKDLALFALPKIQGDNNGENMEVEHATQRRENAVDRDDESSDDVSKELNSGRHD